MNNLGKTVNRLTGFADKTMKNVANLVKRDEVAMLLGAIVVAQVAFLEKDSINPFSYILGNAVVRAITLVLIIYIAMINMPLGLLLSIAFVLTIAHNRGSFSNFMDMEMLEGYQDLPMGDAMKVDDPGAAAAEGGNDEEEEGDAEEGFEDAAAEDEEGNGKKPVTPVTEGFIQGSQAPNLETLVTHSFKADKRDKVRDELKTLISSQGGSEGDMVKKVMESNPSVDDVKKIHAEVSNIAKTGKTLMDGASSNYNNIPMLRGYVAKNVQTMRGAMPAPEPTIEGFAGRPLFAAV